MRFDSANILDELDKHGEEKVRKNLSTFSTPMSPKIENFFRNRAIDFSRRKISVTYLVSDSKSLADVTRQKKNKNIFSI